MPIWEKMIDGLEYTASVPGVFGAYHLFCVFLVIVAAVLAVWFFKDASDMTIRKLCLTALRIAWN